MTALFELKSNIVRYTGIWTLDTLDYQVERQLENISLAQKSTIIFDGDAIESMDSAAACLLFSTQKSLEKKGHTVIWQGFSANHTDLLHMIQKYVTPLNTPPVSPNILEQIGRKTEQYVIQTVDFLAFVGESFWVSLQALVSPCHIRWKAVFANIYSAGVTALPMISVLAFLMGVMLAYQGGRQLSLYGANIFIVDLVGITFLRELSPLLTAIMIAGRSGSAFTAQIGTMHLTHEIDALRTIGIAPMDLLMLPKLFALIIIMPLLTAFADIMGILGGMLIAYISFDVSISDFLERFPQAISLSHYLIGIGKAPVFAAVIAIVSCYQGFRVTGSADSVGKQVTISVVQSIFLVIIVDALFSILFNGVGL